MNIPAHVTVHRDAPGDVGFREIFISMDGEQVAILQPNETFTMAVQPGQHRLRAHNTQHRTERKRSAAEASQPVGELANGSEAHIRRTGGRIGDGVGVTFCVLTRGDLSASADKR